MVRKSRHSKSGVVVLGVSTRAENFKSAFYFAVLWGKIYIFRIESHVRTETHCTRRHGRVHPTGQCVPPREPLATAHRGRFGGPKSDKSYLIYGVKTTVVGKPRTSFVFLSIPVRVTTGYESGSRTSGNAPFDSLFLSLSLSLCFFVSLFSPVVIQANDVGTSAAGFCRDVVAFPDRCDCPLTAIVTADP